MPTQKPRFMVTVPDDLYEAINQYRFTNHFKSQTLAINDLISKGLESLAPENDADVKNEPVISDGLTEVEAEYLNVISELSPSNQRLLLGIGAVILQEQERPPD